MKDGHMKPVDTFGFIKNESKTNIKIKMN